MMTVDRMLPPYCSREETSVRANITTEKIQRRSLKKRKTPNSKKKDCKPRVSHL